MERETSTRPVGVGTVGVDSKPLDADKSGQGRASVD